MYYNEKETENKKRKEVKTMTKKILSMMVKGLNELTSVKFILGALTGAGFIMIGLAHAVGLF